MKQCFGYIRVSTQKQGEGVSLEAQKDAITAFASRQNLTVTEWFEEKETAAKSGPPATAFPRIHVVEQLLVHAACVGGGPARLVDGGDGGRVPRKGGPDADGHRDPRPATLTPRSPA